jgi:biotin carboxyl carrier protein
VRLVVRERQEKLSAWVAGRSFSGQIARAARAGAGGASGDSDLVAQFPGKVRKVLVAEGQEVREGEPLVLVEAMKMEFAVRAPAGGKIRSVLVREGQQLSPGDRFVDFE